MIQCAYACTEEIKINLDFSVVRKSANPLICCDVDQYMYTIDISLQLSKVLSILCDIHAHLQLSLHSGYGLPGGPTVSRCFCFEPKEPQSSLVLPSLPPV